MAAGPQWAKVTYDAVAWPQLHDKMATNFASGTHVWDVIYMSGWVPEFLKFIHPFADKLRPDSIEDMPPSCFSTVTWNGKHYGAVFTLSLLTLFYNTEHFETGRSQGATQDLGRSKALCQGTDARRPLWLGAQLRRPGWHRRRRLLLDDLSATGRWQNVRRRRHAGLQQLRGRRCPPAHGRSIPQRHRPRIDLLRRHQ